MIAVSLSGRIIRFVVNQSHRAAVSGGSDLARGVLAESAPEVVGVPGVEVLVFEALADVDVVHAWVSDGRSAGCWTGGQPRKVGVLRRPRGSRKACRFAARHVPPPRGEAT